MPSIAAIVTVARAAFARSHFRSDLLSNGAITQRIALEEINRGFDHLERDWRSGR